MTRSAFLGALVLVAFSANQAAAQSFMPLRDVRPGMRGYGLTVFQGDRPERFEVEVIDVLHQFLPRQDLIVIKMDHPLLARSGTIGGMSGSPIYVEGRLIGALSYGWLYATEPIAGVTPIEAMLEELRRPLRPERPMVAPLAVGPWRGMPGSLRSNLGVRSRDVPDLAPAATPLLLAGFSPRLRGLLDEWLGPLGLVPLEAGGGGEGRQQRADRPFEPGGALGVQLVRGDLAMTGIGTVTTVQGSRVLAFGHPFLGVGQQAYPVTHARIVTVISNQRRSFKLGEPEAEGGALLQDRQSCVVADMARTAPMTPVEISLHDLTTGRRDRFRVEVVRDPLLLPMLTFSSVAAALDRFASDRTDLTVSLRGSWHLAGQAPVIVTDQAYLEQGASDVRGLFGLRPLQALSAVVQNRFEPVTMERIELELDLDFRREQAEIVGAFMGAEEPRAGTRLPLHVLLRPFSGPEQVQQVMLELPAASQGQELEILIEGGASADPPLPSPYSLTDQLRNLRRSHPATSLVVTLRRQVLGVTVRGYVAQNLPPSALDTLRPLAVDSQEETFRTVAQWVQPIGMVLTGSAQLQLVVGPPDA